MATKVVVVYHDSWELVRTANDQTIERTTLRTQTFILRITGFDMPTVTASARE